VTTALLDANVLIALLWPTHVHHDAAHAWMGGRGQARWATCPLTQLALVRIVSNPTFSADALAPAQALAVLERNLADPRHEFWPDDVGLPEALERSAEHIQGYRQLTDAYLLALAVRHGAVLATFDSGLLAFAGPKANSLTLVPTAGRKRRSR
jgi:uncharacterized protein